MVWRKATIHVRVIHAVIGNPRLIRKDVLSKQAQLGYLEGYVGRFGDASVMIETGMIRKKASAVKNFSDGVLVTFPKYETTH